MRKTYVATRKNNEKNNYSHESIAFQLLQVRLFGVFLTLKLFYNFSELYRNFLRSLL